MNTPTHYCLRPGGRESILKVAQSLRRQRNDRTLDKSSSKKIKRRKEKGRSFAPCGFLFFKSGNSVAMETKRLAMVWFLIVGVVMTTLLVAANPVVNPSPPTEKEKTSSVMKNKPENHQLPQMAPEEAEVFRESIGLDYYSPLGQELTADNEYQEAGDASNGDTPPFFPALFAVVEQPSYVSYDLPQSRYPDSPFKSNRYRYQREKEMMEQIKKFILAFGVNDVPASSSSIVATASSSSLSPSSSPSLEDQLKSSDQSAGKQAKGKTGAPKGRAGKEGAAGKGGGKGKGGGGGRRGGKDREQKAKLHNAEMNLKSVASQTSKNKTKEANPTKSTGLLSKQPVPQ